MYVAVPGYDLKVLLAQFDETEIKVEKQQPYNINVSEKKNVIRM